MAKEDTCPESIRVHLAKTLPQQGGDGALLRMSLNKEENRTTTNIEFSNGYNHGIRTVYNALCLLNIEGFSSIDVRQIHELKKGLENYIIGRK